MKINHLNPPLALFAATAALLLFSGCGPEVKTYVVELETDPALAEKSVLVDIIGATPYDVEVWQTVDLDQYWQPNSPKRAGTEKLTKQFGPNLPTTHRLGAGDVPWKDWKARGVSSVIVIADIPGLTDGPAGNANPRRKILPLTKKHWASGTKVLKVRIQADGIRVDTPVRL